MRHKSNQKAPTLMPDASSEPTEPLVSIIIPAYNHAAYVREALQSVVSQTYQNIELIVIDDGSTDETPRIIRETLEEFERVMRIVFQSQENAGLCTTLNRALALSKGKFVQFLASDDAYLPEKTQRLVEELGGSDESVAAVICDGFIFDERSRRQNVFSDKFLRPLTNSTYRELLVGNWIPALGALYRHDVLKQLGGFDEALEFEDWDLLLRLTKQHQIKQIPDRLFLYRQHGGNLSKNSSVMKRGTQQLAQKHEALKEFATYKKALREREIWTIIKLSKLSNLDLLFRLFLRLLQISKGVSGGSRSSFLRLLLRLAWIRSIKRIRASFYSLTDLKVGKGCLISEGLSISGNRMGVTICNNVYIGRNVVIHLPRSTVLGNLVIREHCVIQDHSVIEVFTSQPVVIGKGCSIGKGAIVQSSGGIEIGRNTMVANYAGIYANNHETSRQDVPFNQQGYNFRGIKIGENCWLGHGVVIADGADIGAHSIVGPNAVVRGKHEPRSRIFGSASLSGSSER